MTQEITMFDAEDAGFNLFRGRIVTPQGIIDGTVEVEGGRIIAVRAGQRAGGSGLDMGADYLIPWHR
jgi:alpha-D-ribose 1-methylphosphonate 5-triphosphate diphosphatase PhnM